MTHAQMSQDKIRRDAMRNRTIGIIGGALLAGALVLGGLGAAQAQAPRGTPGAGPGMMATPGAGMMGPGGVMGQPGQPGSGLGGMMGGQGMMGMMDHMMGMGGQGMMGGWMQGRLPGQALTLDQAAQPVQAYLDQTGNADLALDEVMAFQWNVYAIVKEKSTGTGAFELLVNAATGAVYPEPGPNMMWNTKYGMLAANSPMAQMMGYQPPSGPVTVTPERATQLAREWLTQNQPGTTTEAPDAFPGYYTLHTVKDGQITGMLSVHGYTGQIWYHTWHGAFLGMSEAAH
jgi:hypothetical protein